jgi:hypothetical protein
LEKTMEADILTLRKRGHFYFALTRTVPIALELRRNTANGDIVRPPVSSRLERIMQKSALLAAVQQEIQRHDFRHFVENPPSVAEKVLGRPRLWHVESGMFNACRLPSILASTTQLSSFGNTDRLTSWHVGSFQCFRIWSKACSYTPGGHPRRGESPTGTYQPKSP